MSEPVIVWTWEELGFHLTDIPEYQLDKLNADLETLRSDAFFDEDLERYVEDRENEVNELSQITQQRRVWESIRGSLDRYSLLAETAFNAMQLCEAIRNAEPRWDKEAGDAGQGFQQVWILSERAQRAGKNVPKRRQEALDHYRHSWAIISGLMDQGLDIVPLGFNTLNASLKSEWEQKKPHEPFNPDEPF